MTRSTDRSAAPDPQRLEATATSDAAAAGGRDGLLEDIAIAVHDLRNVLMVVQWAVDLRRQGILMGGSPAEERATVCSASGRAVRLAQELVELCGAATSAPRPDWRPVDLVGLAAEAVDGWRPAFEAAGVWLWAELPDDPVWLEADRERLARVLDNLLGNALKYTEPAGHVTVSVSGRNREAVLRVQDTGVGIPSDFLPRVFDPFTREDSPFVRSRPGSGVGLLAVRRIVELHRGRVEVTSPGPGQGSEFTVRVPTSRTTEQPATAEPARAMAHAANAGSSA